MLPTRPRKAPPIPKRPVAAVSEQKEGSPLKYEEYKLFMLIQKTWSTTNTVGEILALTKERAWELCEEKYGPFRDPINLYETAKGPNLKENFPYVDKMTPEVFFVRSGFLENAMEIPERVRNAKRTIPKAGIDYDISPPKRKPPPWVRR